MEDKKLIIFVCVSNTCRSPMAEYLFRKKIEDLNLSSTFDIESRSLSIQYEPVNSPANPQGMEV
jgi:protein-tyrosine-phosphatase